MTRFMEIVNFLFFVASAASNMVYCKYFAMDNREACIRPASGNHNATLIFLHGLGDSCHGWHQILSGICANHVKVLCPNAPRQAVSMSSGFKMPSWFDIKSLNFDSEEDEEGIVKSSDDLKELIKAEVKSGIPYDRIVIGGFSQGGAVALHTFMTHDQKLGGCVGLSTFLPLHSKFEDITKDANKDTALFLAHGKIDSVVKFSFGKMTKDVLKTRYSNIQWNKYNGLGHSSHDTEMRDVKKFLDETLPLTT